MISFHWRYLLGFVICNKIGDYLFVDIEVEHGKTWSKAIAEFVAKKPIEKVVDVKEVMWTNVFSIWCVILKSNFHTLQTSQMLMWIIFLQGDYSKESVFKNSIWKCQKFLYMDSGLQLPLIPPPFTLPVVIGNLMHGMETN
jgi:hypothetical protein